MTKKMLLMLLFATTISREAFSMFELGKEVTNTKNLVPYPGRSLFTFTTPKKIIVRRSDKTLKYAIAFQLAAFRCDTPLFSCVVDFYPSTKKTIYKNVPYRDIYLAPEWIAKKGHDHANDTCEWSSDAEAGDLLNEIKEQQPACN